MSQDLAEDMDVTLAVRGHVVDLGTITADPAHWRPALAALLRDTAAEIEATELPCPADG